MSEGASGLSGPHESLDDNHKRARYGAAYLRTICAQAGVGFDETALDEDTLAVDGKVKFPIADVAVQIKCTSTRTIGGRSMTFPLEAGWLEKWRLHRLPVYFVVTVVPRAVTSWIDQTPVGTMHHTAAFWSRIHVDKLGKRIQIPKAQRLSVDTMGIWHDDLQALFASMPAGGATT